MKCSGWGRGHLGNKDEFYWAKETEVKIWGLPPCLRDEEKTPENKKLKKESPNILYTISS